MSHLKIIGFGAALPDRVVTNSELESLSGFSAERIKELFEIDERRWARGTHSPDPPVGQRCTDLASAACRDAMSAASVSAGDVGALFVVTTTPDSLNPPPDSTVARNLGMLGIPSFTIQAPCTGVFRAVELASALIPRLDGRPIVVVAAETPSPFFRFGDGISPDQVLNSLLYADGAGAIVVSGDASALDAPAIERIGLWTNSDPGEPGITFPGMLSASPPTADRFESADYLGYHDFRQVLRRGGKLAAEAAIRMMELVGAQQSDVRYFVTHQATGNLKRIGASHGLPPEKIPVNIERIGNTIAASILILVNHLVISGELSRGDLLILHTAESSTWSSAAMAVRW